ncbi:MAG TPA: WD40 repeat domain-containing protein, partial [Gemmataceae bacterium]|nr:WD40 repeat domain-containing protein [Gemmataceae bacterium]
LTISDIRLSEIRRVKLAVTFPDGTTDERLVDVTPGQRIPVSAPPPGPDRPVPTSTQVLTPVTAAALSRDGRFIAVGLEDNAVVLWDTAAGRPVRTFLGHQKPVLSVAFSADARQLLTGSADATVSLWDVATGQRLRTFRGQTGPALSVALSPDGTRVLTGSSDGSARVWDARTGAIVHALKGHPKEVMAVAYSPDGTTLATASADTTAVLWSAETGKQVTVLRGHREGVSCVAFSPDGKRVGTGSWENFGIVWDAATGKRLAATGRHGNDVLSVTFTADGRRLLTGDREEVVQMWDAASGANVRPFLGHSADIIAFAVRPDGRILLTGSRDGTVKLWDLATGRDLVTLMTDASRKAWAVVGPDGLFDASEAGRRVMGLRFAKLPGAELDQFFGERYHPGLLAEVCRGERPFASKPIGRSKPPLLKIVAPKERLAPGPLATVEVEMTDEGGGMSGFAVEVNGARVATTVEPGRRVAVPVKLAPGKNTVRVRAANGDGSWESAPAEIDLTYLPVPAPKGRLYVVAVGASGQAKPLAEMFRSRRGELYDRVDVVPVYDREATKAAVRDTVADVAELTRPQDTIVVILCGPGGLVGDRFHLNAQDGQVDVNELATAMGTAAARKRALIIEVTGDGPRSAFALRGAVERQARSQGVHTIAATANLRSLGPALLAETGPVDVADWFRAAADRAGPAVQCSSKARGFPIRAAQR